MSKNRFEVDETSPDYDEDGKNSAYSIMSKAIT